MCWCFIHYWIEKCTVKQWNLYIHLFIVHCVYWISYRLHANQIFQSCLHQIKGWAGWCSYCSELGHSLDSWGIVCFMAGTKDFSLLENDSLDHVASCLLRCPIPGVKCMGHEAGIWSPFGVEVKNKGSDASAHQHMPWTALQCVDFSELPICLK